MRRTGLIVLGVALIAAATSCGGDSAPETTTTVPTTTAPTTTTVPTTTTTTVAETTTTTQGTGVTATATTFVVQGDLTALGYFDGAIDGIAGEVTRAAIAAFQTDAGIEADGEFGPVTDAAMYPLLQNDRPYVETVQEALAELELYTGPIDGDYGRGTRAAVERLQADCGVEETGDLDIATRLCLFAP